jgi:hypothetical protein
VATVPAGAVKVDDAATPVRAAFVWAEMVPDGAATVTEPTAPVSATTFCVATVPAGAAVVTAATTPVRETGVPPPASLMTTTAALSVSETAPLVHVAVSVAPLADVLLATARPLLASASRDAAATLVNPFATERVHVALAPQSPTTASASCPEPVVAAVVPVAMVAVVLLFPVPAAETSRHPVPADESRPEYSCAVQPSSDPDPLVEVAESVQVPVAVTVAVQMSTNSFPVPETMDADFTRVKAETVAVPADLVGAEISMVVVPLYALVKMNSRLPDVTFDANAAVTAWLATPVDVDLRD